MTTNAPPVPLPPAYSTSPSPLPTDSTTATTLPSTTAAHLLAGLLRLANESLPTSPAGSTTPLQQPRVLHHHQPPLNFTYNGEHFHLLANSSHAPADLITEPLVQTLFCLLYVAIFVVGVFGNVLVCYVVVRNKAMRTVTNLFIMNLALSDILLCFLAVPVTPSYTFLRRWVFGVALCHLMLYAQGCSVYVSSLTLTSIAIDRFCVIMHPFQPRMRLGTCAAIVLGIWSFALLVTLPYGLYIDHYTELVHGHSYCEESWPSEESRKLFSTLTSSLQFVLPFLVVSFCYVRVSLKLNDRARRKPGSKTSHKERLDRARKKRTNRMLIAMVAVFGVSWLPLNCVNILNDFCEHCSQWRYYNLLFFVAHTIAMSSTCYNPFLYAWLNENFRKEFKQVLPCFRRRPPHACLGNGAQWRSARTLNGRTETLQESLLPSTCFRPNGGALPEIIPRGPTAHEEDRLVFKQRLQASSVDSLRLSEVVPPLSGGSGGLTPKTWSGETIRLPSGVLETPFDGAASGDRVSR